MRLLAGTALAALLTASVTLANPADQIQPAVLACIPLGMDLHFRHSRGSILRWESATRRVGAGCSDAVRTKMLIQTKRAEEWLWIADDVPVIEVRALSLSSLKEGQRIGFLSAARRRDRPAAEAVWVLTDDFGAVPAQPWDWKPGLSLSGGAVVERSQAAEGVQLALSPIGRAKPIVTQIVFVSERTPIVELLTSDRSALVSGASVFTRTAPGLCDCQREIHSIFVGRGALVPPM